MGGQSLGEVGEGARVGGEHEGGHALGGVEGLGERQAWLAACVGAGETRVEVAAQEWLLVVVMIAGWMVHVDRGRSDPVRRVEWLSEGDFLWRCSVGVVESHRSAERNICRKRHDGMMILREERSKHM
jgi:hypothetical protein